MPVVARRGVPEYPRLVLAASPALDVGRGARCARPYFCVAHTERTIGRLGAAMRIPTGAIVPLF